MSMSIGGATVAMVENRHGGMYCEAHPNRLALVLALIDSGAIGLADSYHGSDAHKSALDAIEQRIRSVREGIAEREKRDAYIEFVREPWIKQAAARYVERGELDEDEARRAAASLFDLIANDGDGEMLDAAQAADEDMATWAA